MKIISKLTERQIKAEAWEDGYSEAVRNRPRPIDPIPFVLLGYVIGVLVAKKLLTDE